MNDDCDCCTGNATIAGALANRPGLGALRYRVGTHNSFLQAMIERLTTLSLVASGPAATGASAEVRPLARLTTRESRDPAIALLDAWAVLLDVLTFYQERIVNEGYLETAREARSLTELAKLIGYRPRPGVSASVYLAFKAALDFQGVIPAGTRAQSIPGTGEKPQFFETSEALKAHYAWNLLAPRVESPQLITLPDSRNTGRHLVPVVTGADVVDVVYLEGTAAAVKTGDALLFVFGSEAGLQVLRHIESSEAQADQDRTEVKLKLRLPNTAHASELLLPFIDKAIYLFPDSELAGEVAELLQRLLGNIRMAETGQQAVDLIRSALVEVRETRDVAVARKFSRMATWADHLILTLEWAMRLAGTGSLGDVGEELDEGELPSLDFVAPKLPVSPLAKLASIVDGLSLPPSIQPVNAKRLARSVAGAFSPQADTAPRVLAALKPRASAKLYSAWNRVRKPAERLQVHAMRARASLFAHNFAGKPRVTRGVTTFTAPTLSNAWGLANLGNRALDFVVLDAVYDQVKPGSWVVVDRPGLDEHSDSIAIAARRTYHRVVEVQASTLEAGADTGFSAKVSRLTVSPAWLDDMTTQERSRFLDSTLALRGTAVYVQSEGVTLAKEPLDTDIQGDSIELDRVYDGLDAGRWIIVSGERTDIPNVEGVTASELVMVAGVAQGERPPLSVDFPLSTPPFAEVYYTSGASSSGDRLVVGRLVDRAALFGAGTARALALPSVPNQQYRDQVELAPGVYANAYVPTERERFGLFPEFSGQLVDPNTHQPFPLGDISKALSTSNLFAWRVRSKDFHSVLTLANRLSYKYDTRSIKIFGNVVQATHGHSAGEVLGDGDARQAFQSFALGQKPLTHLAAPSVAGAESTLSVRVNEIEWHEKANLAALDGSGRNFITEANDDAVVRVVFGDGKRGARVPSGRSNVKAAYRYGIGKAGNVKAEQISVLATRPLGAEGVVNPLPASGGADRDTPEETRLAAPLSVTALDRLVSVADYAAFTRGFAGIGKAHARELTDGRRQLVHVSIAGKDDAVIDETSDLYKSLVISLQRYGDPNLPVHVALRRARLLVISARVQLLPDYAWESVEPLVRSAVLSEFSFARRALGQSAFASEALEAMHRTEGVSHVHLEAFDSVGQDVTAGELASLAKNLSANAFVQAQLARLQASGGPSNSAGSVLPAELVFLTPNVPETLLLRQLES